MKKYFPMILSLLFSFLGIGMFFYPNVSDWYIKHHQEKIIQAYGRKTKRLSEETLEKEKRAVKAYNQSLLENKTMLTDPFYTVKIKPLKKEYKKRLAFDEVMAYVEIPKIGVYIPVYHGTSKKTLEKGLGHLEQTSLPMGGKGSHCVISGHSGLPTAFFFTDLEKLKQKDFFYIHVLDKVLAYQVDQIRVILPEDISFFRIEPDKDYVTLVTCTPFGQNTHRLLVRGCRSADNKRQGHKKKAKKKSLWNQMKELFYHQKWLRKLLGTLLGLIVAGVIICLKKRLKKVH